MIQPSAAATDQSWPVFLVGAERSGSTLLRLLLAHHPRLAWLNEFEYAVDRMPPSPARAWPDTREYARWLSTHRVFQATGFAIDPALSYPDLLRSFLEQHRLRTGREHVGATVHRHFDRVLRVWPDARFIHIVRDPRDVARSCIGMGWAGNVYMAIERWIDAERLWDSVAHAVSTHRRIDVRYEDVAERSEGTLASLCDFLGVPYDAAMLEIDRDTTYERPNGKFATQWRGKMPDREVQLVEGRVGELLIQRGYPPSGLVARPIGGMERVSLRAQDRFVRWRFRIRRFGLRLWLADALSRRVPIPAWRHRVIGRVNQVVAEHLK